ncbi:MAG: exodeoxyribonuclease VII large subunit [Lachnospiraceae bacterium]|nr:exodeoxyribonuclease VII large subunit [Lachnospiraceae bacterium]
MQKVYSVSQINTYIRTMFTQDFVLNRLSVRGEVSNLKYHTSGHIYFSLKDAGGTIACVMFAGMRAGLTFRLANGQQIVVDGNVNVYERDGKYQLYASRIRLDGAGELYERFLALKAELEEMGMFAPEYKKEIPVFVRRLGVVTAPTGAAVRDIINIATRRNPGIQIILYPAQVQGEGAAASVASGLEALDQMDCDVIIVGRGGGSIEDLWAFNEEEVARAIFACQTPVISAVGHETDTTIADYVADLRAPTPSAAAELAVLDVRQILQQLDAAEEELTRRMRRIIYTKRQALSQVRLQQQMEQVLKAKRNRLQQYQIHLRYLEPMQRVREQRQQLADAQEHLQRSMEQRAQQYRNRLRLYAEQMRRCSPLEKLAQGYGLITNESGERVHSVSQVKEGELLDLYVSDGKITVQVQKIEQTDRE